MAHESFEDEVTAAYMDEHFVSIKVDREERPDVDAVYMQATVAMTGNGGWPMTVVLDHDANPWFAGTCFPDTPRHGQASFRQLLEALTAAWRERPDGVRQQAAQLREHLQAPATLPSSPISPGDLDAAVASLGADFDPFAGGFGRAPKFPPSMVLEFLLRHGSEDALRMVDRTLDGMIRGGIHDQLGGGFARYSVDGGWVVPHFEKMLYDNALTASSARPGPAASRSPTKARHHPTAVVLVSDAARDDVPLLVGRHPVDGKPAAYVCRHHVCAAPVTEPDDLVLS